MQTFAAPKEIPVPEFDDFRDADGKFSLDRMDQLEAEYRKQLAEWIKANGQPHALAGKTVSVPFADGGAEYMIGRFNNKVTLIHVPLGDAWHDDRFCRLATVAELKRMVS